MITPIILCGGAGTRLWPLSRKSYPKQFSQLIGDVTLFQASVLRFAAPGYAPPVVVTTDSFRFIVAEQLDKIGIEPGDILIEPEGRDTAAAVLAGTMHVALGDADATILVAPSDHLIPETDLFADAVEAARESAARGLLVTFGITPDRPETGYGYLALGARPDPAAPLTPLPLKGFVEKPDAERAAVLFDDGWHLWNSGIFMFRADAIIDAFTEHAPDMPPAVAAAIDGARRDLGFVRLDPEVWAGITSISIDYAVMEKATNLVVVPYAGRWSDLGDWAAIWRETEKSGVATFGAALAIDCTDTLLRSESPGQQVVGIGLDDIVAVAMPDAVLVAHKSRAQDVKEVVTALKSRNAVQAEIFPVDHRPWGWFESLVVGSRFQVKRIVVHPGAALSLQSHHHRSEHWIVVEGTARVTVDDDVKLVAENQSIYIPLGARHRMENPGKVPMVLIEVQTGSYLGEDDIIRYEDVYARE